VFSRMAVNHRDPLLCESVSHQKKKKRERMGCRDFEGNKNAST
jgi:hypothetical protein